MGGKFHQPKVRFQYSHYNIRDHLFCLAVYHRLDHTVVGMGNFLALQTTLLSDTFKEIASGWIASGQIGIYYKHFYFDNFHPIWYSIFLSLLIARTFKVNGVNPKFNFFILMPFIAGACDLIENAMHLYFLSDLKSATPALVALSGTATNTKWFLAFSGVAIVSILVVTWFVKTFIIKKR
jgi:hypothetical protein